MSVIARLFNFVAATPAIADNVDAEFDSIVGYINANCILKDGTVTFTAPQPGVTPAEVGDLVTKGYADGQVSAGLPSGFIATYSGLAPPTGWLLCDGTAVSRTTYANLYNVCGVAYGAGNGYSTFNVPDLRSRFPVGTCPTTVSGWRPIRGMGSNGGQSVSTKYYPAQYAVPATLMWGVPNAVDDNMPPFVAVQYLVKT